MSRHLSNYPPGVTTADLPGWRPYAPHDNSNECVSCTEELLDYEKNIYHGQLHCPRCIPHCEECGEPMSDELRLQSGERVRYAGYEGHAECVAYCYVGQVAGIDFDMVDFLSREEIATWLKPMAVLV